MAECVPPWTEQNTKAITEGDRIPCNKGYCSQEPDFIETAESRFIKDRKEDQEEET